MSRKNNRQLAFESTLEHDFFLTLEFDQLVTSFEEQPFKLRYECDGSNRFYTPDALVNYHKSSTVFEVKYKDELDNEELRQKFSCIAHQIESEGKYNFMIFTDTTFDQVYLQNLKFLYKFAFLKNTETFDKRFICVYEDLSDPMSLMDFLHAIDTDSSNHGKIIPYLWHFLALNPNLIDLTQKLSMNSLLIKDPLWQK